MDAVVCEMPILAVSRINCIAKRQKYLRSLKFGDRQNLVD